MLQACSYSYGESWEVESIFTSALGFRNNRWTWDAISLCWMSSNFRLEEDYRIRHHDGYRMSVRSNIGESGSTSSHTFYPYRTSSTDLVALSYHPSTHVNKAVCWMDPNFWFLGLRNIQKIVDRQVIFKLFIVCRNNTGDRLLAYETA
jgi:hypothetical protein